MDMLTEYVRHDEVTRMIEEALQAQRTRMATAIRNLAIPQQASSDVLSPFRVDVPGLGELIESLADAIEGVAP
jgi:flagellar basal body rod protein FlgC